MSASYQLIAIVCTGLSVFVLCLATIRIAVQMWSNYEQKYIEESNTTLDAMYVNMPAQNVLYLSIISFLGGTALVAILFENLLLGLGAGIILFFIPKIMLGILKKRRDELFGIQLIDALMSASNSLRAGFSLTQALELIHREMPNPMSQEIRLTCQELRLGRPIEEALRNLYRRMPSQDIDLMVTAITIVSDVGGNLTEVFDNIAATVRERHRIEGKIRALTAQGRMQAWVVSAMPFLLGLGMYFVAPGMLRLMYTTTLGIVVLVLIAILIAIGSWFIQKIVNIDV